MKQKYDEIELKSTKLEEQVGALKEDLELANYQNKIVSSTFETGTNEDD